MDCPHCKTAGLPENARFCTACGQPVRAQSSAAPTVPHAPSRPGAAAESRPTVSRSLDRPGASSEEQPPASQHQESGSQININQSVKEGAGRTVGAEIGRLEGGMHVAHMTVVIRPDQMPLAQQLEAVRAMSAIPTEAPPGGLEGQRTPEGIERTNRQLGQIADAARAQNAETVEVGGVRVQRVDVLLKQAVGLRIAAEQMRDEHARKHKPRKNPVTGQVDYLSVFAGFDQKSYEAKLTQAREALHEALSIDPGNTEVLLNLAQVLTVLTPDPEDERRVLYEIKERIGHPRDEAEKFRLAQATYLLAASHEPVETRDIRFARDTFASMGRTDWVSRCDELLGASSAPDKSEAPPRPERKRSAEKQSRRPASQDPDDEVQEIEQQPGEQFTQHGPFNPVGRWKVQVMSLVPGTIDLNLLPNGTLHATQRVNLTGQSFQAQGTWAFDPMSNFLQLQGMNSLGAQFFMALMVQGREGKSWSALGMDGIAYTFTRA